MIAKIVTHGSTRERARRRLRRALLACTALGTITNRSFLLRILDHPRFVTGEATTSFLAREADSLHPRALSHDERIILAALMAECRGRALEIEGRGWSSTGALHTVMRLEIEGEEGAHDLRLLATGEGRWSVEGEEESDHVHIELEPMGGTSWRVGVDGYWRVVDALFDGVSLHVRLEDRDLVASDLLRRVRTSKADSRGGVVAPMTGKIIGVVVEQGDHVTRGDLLATLEAMKMEHELRAPHDGLVTTVDCEVGEQVSAKRLLFEIEEEQETR